MSEYQPARRRDPSSPLRKGTESMGRDLADFWTRSESDLLSNTTRGLLAEYIVGIALGCTDGTVRREWDAFDLLTESGLRIEVKSSAYLHSWQQKSASAIKFAVGPATAWFAETNSYAEVRERSADVSVFCLFTTADRAVADPLDVDQWTFYVASTTHINAAIGEQKTITLASLRSRVQPLETGFGGLLAAVEDAGRSKRP